MTALPVFVIGQTPRPDLVAELAAAAPGLAVTLRGALDGLDRAAIADLAPRDPADALFTRLPSGEATTVSKAAISARLAPLLPAGPALLACTGAFPDLADRAGLILPSAVLNAVAGAVLPRGRLGLCVPIAEQIPVLTALRTRPGVTVRAVVLTPGSDDAARDAAAASLADFAPDLLVLDCISYTRVDKARLAARLGCPVLLSVAVAARVAASLLPE